ncbi:MAG: sulfotransferase family 2 domain-containing protein [Gammaproteobacteria bacterium]
MPLFQGKDRTTLFVHIPKTGGSSVEAWLSRHTKMSLFSPLAPAALKVCPQHLPHSDLLLLLGEGAWDYAFAVVRNPYERLVSEFFFREPVVDGQQAVERVDFSAWVITHLQIRTRNPHYMDNHLRPQVEFLGAGVEVFRYEAGLGKAAAAVARHAAVPLDEPLPQLRSSKKCPVSFSNEALALVNRVYAEDFSELGYEKRRQAVEFAGS